MIMMTLQDMVLGECSDNCFHCCLSYILMFSMYFWFSVKFTIWRTIMCFSSVPSLRLMNIITCFPSSGGGKVVPAQPPEEGPARRADENKVDGVSVPKGQSGNSGRGPGDGGNKDHWKESDRYVCSRSSFVTFHLMLGTCIFVVKKFSVLQALPDLLL